MKLRNFKSVSKPSVVKRIALIFSVLIGIVLAIAAWGKFFYPAEFVKTLDQWVSLFEVAFLVAIIIFRKHWGLWLFAAVIFGGWSGYAIYWCCLQLPCNCMGAMLDIPTPLSIAVDIFFCAASLFLAFLQGAKRSWIYFSVLSCFMAGLVGYAFADWVYQNVVVRM
ncbi:MAG: hypothetical protein JSS60_01420 [Verrucomicrobia bacterium]|nr:hypothetical protein [Verrucomicrobiota bacterium]